MRVFFTLLVIAVTLQVAFSVSLKAQNKLLMEQSLVQLQATPFGRAMKNMITIASKLGYNYQDLYDAFSALKNNLLNNLENEEQLFAEYEYNHVLRVQYLNSNINDYSNEITRDEAAIVMFTQRLEYTNEQLSESRNQLQGHYHQRDEAQLYIDQFLERLQLVQAEQQEVAQVIQEALDKLQEANFHYQQGNLDGVSFIQVKNTYYSFAQKISTASKKLAAKHQIFIKPVIQAMLAVNQSNQNSIEIAIDALRNLLEYFQKALTDLENEYYSQKAYIDELVSNLNIMIDELQNQVIPGLEQKVRAFEAVLQQINDELILAREGLLRAQNELEAENANWESIVARHKAHVERVNFEYDLVQRAERIVRTAQNNLEE